MDETKLIKACQKGNRQAFDELIRMFYPYVTKFLIKNTCDEELTQDLCQETFIKMIKSIDKFSCNGSASFGTWLITIAKNTYIDYLRKNRIITESIDDLNISDVSDVNENTIIKMQYEELLKAIETLPHEQTIAIKMKYIEQLTLAEIAEKLGVQPKTVKSRIHEGKTKLRRLFADKRKDDNFG